MAEFKTAFENTYRLEPLERQRFFPSKVRECIEMVVMDTLKDKTYNHQQAKDLAFETANRIKGAVKQLDMPNYKIVVQTVIGELNGQGIRVASKCLWDDKNDNFATFTY